MIGEPLWLPPGVCPHSADALCGELNPPTLAVMCRRCGSAWDQDSVPGGVVDMLTELLDQGRFKPKRPKPALER